MATRLSHTMPKPPQAPVIVLKESFVPAVISIQSAPISLKGLRPISSAFVSVNTLSMEPPKDVLSFRCYVLSSILLRGGHDCKATAVFLCHPGSFYLKPKT